MSVLPFLNPIIHNALRLGVMSILAKRVQADFVYLRGNLGATSGNLSVQLRRLQRAGYITILKEKRSARILTICTITAKGAEEYKAYLSAIKSYID